MCVLHVRFCPPKHKGGASANIPCEMRRLVLDAFILKVVEEEDDAF